MASSTRQTPDGIESEKYESLAELIAPYLDLPFDDLPESLRKRVTRAFFSMRHWDELTPDRRRWRAQKHDIQHDPEMERENEYWFGLQCEVNDTEAKIVKWELLPDHTPSDALAKENRLAELRGRLLNLDKLWGLPAFIVEDWTLTNAELDQVVRDAKQSASERRGDETRSASAGTLTVRTPGPQAAPARLQRRDLLTPAIDAAQKECGDPYDAPAVWAKLRSMADEKKTPLLGATEEGLKWIDGNDNPQTLSMANLRDRLSRRKKAAALRRDKAR